MPKTLAILVNMIVPGIGTLLVGKVMEGAAQFILYFVGLLISVTIVGAVIGLPLSFAIWIWGIVSVATA